MKIRSPFACALVVVIACAIVSEVHAEKFLLKTGQTVEGIVVRSLGKTLSIKLPERGMQQLPISEVDHVELTLGSGERVVGELISWSSRGYEIRTPDGLLSVKDGEVILEVAADSDPTKQIDRNEGVGGPSIALANAGHEERPKADPEAETTAIAAAIPMLTGSSTPIDENASEAVFHLRLSEAAPKPLLVIYSVIEGSAKNGSDYKDNAGVARIDAGELGVDISVPIINDDLAERDEEFELFISVDPKAASLERRRIETIIRDDDS